MFGWLRARRGDQLVTRFRTQKTGALLAFLAHHSHRSHPREEVIELLWPDADLAAGRNSLSHALSSLRHQLEPPGVPAGAVIVADRYTVRVDPDACATDVARFEAALRAASASASPTDTARLLSDAVDLYRGEFLPGYYEEWSLAERDRLAERHLAALEDLVAALERAGDLERAAEYARRAIAADPLREEAHRALMRLRAAAGEPSAALRQYRQLERILRDELGAEPSPETRALARSLDPRTGAGKPPAGVEERRGAPAAAKAAAAPPADPAGALPAGTVTLLLAEGATLLGEALARHGGHRVRGGDPFLVAFARPSDALACALACRAALAVGARMALHTGEVGPRDREYGGAVSDWAARVLAASHPGQLLCSEDAAVLLRRELEPGVRLVDLGPYRLSGPPERLVQGLLPRHA